MATKAKASGKIQKAVDKMFITGEFKDFAYEDLETPFVTLRDPIQLALRTRKNKTRCQLVVLQMT